MKPWIWILLIVVIAAAAATTTFFIAHKKGLKAGLTEAGKALAKPADPETGQAVVNDAQQGNTQSAKQKLSVA